MKDTECGMSCSCYATLLNVRLSAGLIFGILLKHRHNPIHSCVLRELLEVQTSG